MSDGTAITYTSAAGFASTATFSYTVSDGSLTASATVRVRVTPDVRAACTLYIPIILRMQGTRCGLGLAKSQDCSHDRLFMLYGIMRQR
jgi:hypothetical protein